MSDVNAFSIKERDRSMFSKRNACQKCSWLDRLTLLLVFTMFVLTIVLIVVNSTRKTALLQSTSDQTNDPNFYGVKQISMQNVPFDFTGRWSYRSYHQVPNPLASPKDLLFARGIMEIIADPISNRVSGILRGADKNSGGKEWGLTLEGFQKFTNSSHITVHPVTGERTLIRAVLGELEMVGYGLNGTDAEGWVYEYRGTMISPWDQNAREDVSDEEGAPVPSEDSTTNPFGIAKGGGFPGSQTVQQPTWTGSVIRRCCHEPKGLVAVAAGTRINSGLVGDARKRDASMAANKKISKDKGLPVNGVLSQIVASEAEHENVQYRRNYLHITQEERDEYARGINLLRKLPSRLKLEELPENLRFPGVQEKLTRFDDYVIIHQSHRSLAHASPAFLPWHRVLLVNFEKDLQTVLNNSHFMLPYWDWSDESTRDQVWTKENLGSQAIKNTTIEKVETYSDSETPNPTIEENVKVDWLVDDGPFADWKHFVGLNQSLIVGYGLQRCFGCDLPPPPPGGHSFMNTDIPPELPTISNVTETLSIGEYDRPPWNDASHPSFRNALEGWEEVGCSMHNAVHLWVGGHMRDVPIAPNDPVFWLHHAYVDKLWDLWQRKHGYTYSIHRGYLPDKRHDPNRIRQRPTTGGSSAPGGSTDETKEEKEHRINEEMKQVRPGESYTLHPWLYAHDSAKAGTHRFDQLLPWNVTVQLTLNPINLGYVYQYDSNEDSYIWS